MRWLMNLLVALLLAIVAGILPSQPTRHAPNPTPTLDRLAPPPTVASPTQADVGAQVYWLNCQPCHGDRSQGLTDEWFAAGFAAAMWGLDAAQLQRTSAVEHMPDDFRL